MGIFKVMTACGLVSHWQRVLQLLATWETNSLEANLIMRPERIMKMVVGSLVG